MSSSKLEAESNKRYTSGKVLKKAVFNLAFQIVPIIVALVFIPLLINSLGKDYWAKYTAGVSAIFLANYFSFGIGPAINRRVSELIGAKRTNEIGKEVTTGIALSFALSIAFLFLYTIFMLLAYQFKALSILTNLEDLYFFLIIGLAFFVVFISIPYKSLLESYSDFYFLAIIRAISAAGLFIVPYVLWVTGIFKLYWASIVLAGYYTIVFIIMFFRTEKNKRMLSLDYGKPFGISTFFSSIKGNFSFAKEAFRFGVFFLCSAIVLFFDRYYYSLYINTQILSDHVTLLDLFNRVAIITGTISLVYFSAISVWYNEGNLGRIRKNLRLQLIAISAIFIGGLFISYFILTDFLQWWLKGAYSPFIAESAFFLLVAVFFMNFEILMVRPLQAIGRVNDVNKILVATTLIYILIVSYLGISDLVQYHYWALMCKAIIDCLFLLRMLLKEKII